MSPASSTLSPASGSPIRAAYGTYTLISRLYSDLAPYQVWREVFENCVQAGARKVTIARHEPSWGAHQHRKRMVSDDGEGMTPELLARVTANLGASGKDLGLTKNIGVGAKIATLPWNTHGLVYVTLRDGLMSMAWIEVDEATGTAYFRDLSAQAGLTALVYDSDGQAVVFEPGVVEGVDWAATLPAFVRAAGHGTSVVLMGVSRDDNTLAGDVKKEKNSETTTVLVDYLDSRYFRFPEGIDVSVQRYKIDGSLQHAAKAYGFSGKLDNFIAMRGVCAEQGTVDVVAEVDGAVVPAVVRWVLMDPNRRDGSDVREWLRKKANAAHLLPPWVGLVYDDELFGRDYLTTSHRQDSLHLGHAGITYKDVQNYVYLFLEPRAYNEDSADDLGAAMDTGRKNLGLYRRGGFVADLPVREWLGDFARKMPAAIQARIDAASDAAKSESLNEDQFISDLFAEMTKIRAYVAKPGGGNQIAPVIQIVGNAAGETPVGKRKGVAPGDPHRRGTRGGNGSAGESNRSDATSRRNKVASLAQVLGGSVDAQAVEVFKSRIPRVVFRGADEFCDGDDAVRLYLAKWTPGAEEDPGEICINTEAPTYAAFAAIVEAEAGSAPWNITDPSELHEIHQGVFKRTSVAGIIGALIQGMTEGLAESPLAVSMTCIGDATLMGHLRHILDLRRPARVRRARAS